MGNISSSQASSGLLLQDCKDVTPSPCAVTRIVCVSHRTIAELGTHRTPVRCAGLAEHTTSEKIQRLHEAGHILSVIQFVPAER